MKRIDIHYGGERYSVGGRDLDDLREDVRRALAGGGDWLEVNDGEGTERAAYLLITPGVSIAIVPVPDGDQPRLTPIVDISDTLVPS